MRLLMGAPSPGLQGGIPRFASLLAEHLGRQGCEVATLPWGRPSNQSGRVARVVALFRNLQLFRRALRSGRYDLMLLNTAHDWAGVLRDSLLLACTRHLVPCRVLQFHGCDSESLGRPGRSCFKLFSRYLARASDGLLVLSSEEQRDWSAFEPTCHCRVVSSPFDVREALASGAGGNGSPARAGATRFLFASRVMPEKGIFELVEAMSLVLKEQRCGLRVAGDGPALLEARERAAQLGLGESVTFLGYVDQGALWREYLEAEVFVLPTRWREGFPAVIVEAMAAGLPIITTRVRGIADHLVEGVNALFIPARPAMLLAEAMLKLLRDAGLRARMGAANRAKVKEFAPEVVVPDYLRALQELRAIRG